MGRAIVRHPQSFLMDEPLSNLDAKLRVQMRAELVKLHQRLGVTTLYVTHDQVEAMTLGQRVAVLNHGVVQQVDAPDVLYNRPANTFVASFIGSPSMNFVRARSDGRTISFGGFSLPLPESVVGRLRRKEGDMLVGLRPEHFSDARVGDRGAQLPVTVEITEQLGSETLVYFRVDGVDAESIGRVGGGARGRVRCPARPAVPSVAGGAPAGCGRHRASSLLRPGRRSVVDALSEAE